MSKKLLFFILIAFTGFNNLIAQPITNLGNVMPARTKVEKDTVPDKDVVDAIKYVFNRKSYYKPDTSKADKKGSHFAAVPAAGYSLQTGFAAILAANLVFNSDTSAKSKESTILANVSYTQYNQIIFPINADIWTKGNKYDIISDFRYMNYPSVTFGLGPKSLASSGYNIDFSYLKIHQSVLRNLSHNFFGGIGYYYDYFWKEKEVNPPADAITSFETYGLHPSETASGICLEGLYDNRDNEVNATKGFYANLRLRNSVTWLGGSGNWQQGILELKKYITVPGNSKNVIAFWSYNWLTLGGKPPYLLLPSIGWDDFFNTGRGYIQGRYRDKNMEYLEAEYRFRILNNGLLGGVVFASAQTYSETFSSSFETIIPGYGLGLRIKINKHSNTNLCIDYGFGVQGSRGFFVNLGEVF